jgi:hypothetical protein
LSYCPFCGAEEYRLGTHVREKHAVWFGRFGDIDYVEVHKYDDRMKKLCLGFREYGIGIRDIGWGYVFSYRIKTPWVWRKDVCGFLTRIGYG